MIQIRDSPAQRTHFWCGDGKPPSAKAEGVDRIYCLDTAPGAGNVFVKFENISSKLIQDLPAIIKDLVEIGSYVYCADQRISRGGDAGSNNGEAWQRNLSLNIAVRSLEVWTDPKVKTSLEKTIGFLSGEQISIDFRKLQSDIPDTGYFHLDEGTPWYEAESVSLFSGGLDSLAGAVEDIVNNGRNSVLVSHRPVSKVSSWQKTLLAELVNATAGHKRPLHVPVWINKDKGLTHDVTQRTRSFLYACLGGSLAYLFGLQEVKFYENGIISSNLPFAGQIVGSRASRSTHPLFLKYMSEFLSLVFRKNFTVVNPFFTKTKSEVVQVIGDAGLAKLISLAHTCSHVRTSTKVETHCGVCSQCVERRFATEYAKLSKYDPQESYSVDLFEGELKKPEAKQMVLGYVSRMRGIEDANEDDFLEMTPEAYRLIDALDMKPSAAADLVFELHKRQAAQVAEVLERKLKSKLRDVRRGELPDSSMLASLIRSQSTTPRASVHRFPTPPGSVWKDIRLTLKSLESLDIRVGAERKVVTAYDIGFRDNRIGDSLNKQWELLRYLAENNGSLGWKDRGAKANLQKRVSDLNRTLRTYFGLKGNPVSWSKSESMYQTSFTVSDESYH